MKFFPNTLKKVNLLIFLCISTLYFSCSDDLNDFPFYQTGEEIIISETTTDTIVNLIVGNAKVPVYLSFPKDCKNANYPAVVVLHGSDGMWKNHDSSTRIMSGQNTAWSELFNENCIVGAYVDSYSGRGATTRTGKWAEAPDNFKISSQFIRSRDANATLELLKKLRFEDGSAVIRSENVGLLGFSDGASAVASTLYDTDTTPIEWEWTQSFNGKEYTTSSGVMAPEPKPEEGFAGGVFYYGGSGGYNYWGASPCGQNSLQGNIYRTYAPLLYQIPEEGYLSENTICLVDLLKEKGDPVEFYLYEGVSHGFDYDDVPQSKLARLKTITWFKKILDME